MWLEFKWIVIYVSCISHWYSAKSIRYFTFLSDLRKVGKPVSFACPHGEMQRLRKVRWSKTSGILRWNSGILVLSQTMYNFSNQGNHSPPPSWLSLTVSHLIGGQCIHDFFSLQHKKKKFKEERNNEIIILCGLLCTKLREERSENKGEISLILCWNSFRMVTVEIVGNFDLKRN